MNGRNGMARLCVAYDMRMTVIMIELNCPIARSLNAEPGCGAAITESPSNDTLPADGGYETPFSRTKFSGGRGLADARATGALRATANLLSIKCIQQRNSG